MAPRVEGLSAKQTQALRLLALGGGAMRYGKLWVRFTHPEGGLHVDIPLVAVNERLIASSLIRDAGFGTYLVTPAGKKISDETAAAYREMWKPHEEAREEARKR